MVFNKEEKGLRNNKQSREWYRNHPEVNKRINHSWYLKNKEKNHNRVNEYRNKNPDKVKKYSRKHTLKKYGLTVESFNNILKKQKFKCLICKEKLNFENSKFVACDHCHKSGKFRGILCQKCNMGLGIFKDDIKILKNAIKYLEKNK